MKIKYKILVGILMLALMGGSVSACNYYCNNCADCEAKITAANTGEVICLNQHIRNHFGTCITNPAGFNNKTFDCKGHVIDGDDQGNDYGVLLDGKNNNIIKNCVITGFDQGIYLFNSSNNTLIKNSIKLNNYVNVIGNWTPACFNDSNFIEYKERMLLSVSYVNAQCLFCLGISTIYYPNPIFDLKHEMYQKILVDQCKVRYYGNSSGNNNSNSSLRMAIDGGGIMYSVHTDYIPPTFLLNDKGGLIDSKYIGKMIFLGQEYFVRDWDDEGEVLRLVKGAERTLDNKAVGGDFTAGDGTYRFKVHEILKFGDGKPAAIVMDIEKPDGNIVQVLAKRDLNAVVGNVEIYVLDIATAGEFVQADVLVYDLGTTIVLENNESYNNEGEWLIELVQVPLGCLLGKTDYTPGQLSIGEGYGLDYDPVNNTPTRCGDYIVNPPAGDTETDVILDVINERDRFLGYNKVSVDYANVGMLKEVRLTLKRSYNGTDVPMLNVGDSIMFPNDAFNFSYKIALTDRYGVFLNSSLNNTLMSNNLTNNNIGIYSQQSISNITSNLVCENLYSDFSSPDWYSSYGENNTCDNSGGWNDTGANGCNHSCSFNCIPEWICTEWSNCDNNNQTRICIDKNKCGANSGEPNESQSCFVNSASVTDTKEIYAEIVFDKSKAAQLYYTVKKRITFTAPANTSEVTVTKPTVAITSPRPVITVVITCPKDMALHTTATNDDQLTCEVKFKVPNTIDSGSYNIYEKEYTGTITMMDKIIPLVLKLKWLPPQLMVPTSINFGKLKAGEIKNGTIRIFEYFGYKAAHSIDLEVFNVQGAEVTIPNSYIERLDSGASNDIPISVKVPEIVLVPGKYTGTIQITYMEEELDGAMHPWSPLIKFEIPSSEVGLGNCSITSCGGACYLCSGKCCNGIWYSGSNRCCSNNDCFGGICLSNQTCQSCANNNDTNCNSAGCIFGDVNKDGIITQDWNDLTTAYKCFLGLNKNCDKINYQDWANMKNEYDCFSGN